MSRLRVLHLTLSSFGGSKKGGGERYVTELVAAQSTLGADARVVELPSFTRAPVLVSDKRANLSLRAVFQLARQAHVVHVHQLNSPGFDVAALSRISGGPKIVLTDHGGGGLSPARALGKLRLRLIAGGAFVSEWSRVDIDPEGMISPYSIVYGGGDHLPQSSGRRFSADFAVVGRVLPHKGAHIAVAALPADKSLIVAGQFRDKAYRDHLADLARGKRVQFVDDLTDEDLPSVYNSVTALLVPSVDRYGSKVYSRPELLGLVALEALALGTPVVGSDVGGLGELLGRERQTVVPNGDVRAWSSVLENFDPASHSVEASAYTWRGVARSTLNLYDAVLAGG